MDGIVQAFGCLDIKGEMNVNPTLHHDVFIIVYCWQQRVERLLVDELVIEPGEFKSTSALFEHLCAHVPRGVSVIDIMPYIDDYLEYYDMLCRIF